MNITRDIIPSGRNNRPGHSMEPQYLTIHDTGNTTTGADAKTHSRYLKGQVAENVPVSWHFTVDESKIIQHLPLDENGWHAGDGAEGEGNRNSIGIEICENKDGDRESAEIHAAQLVVFLISEVTSLKPFPGCLKQHWDWTQKDCPAVLRRGEVHNWEEWMKLINDIKEEKENVPEWKTEAIDYFANRDMLHDPEDWKDRVNEPMPVWAAFIMLKRIHSEGEDNS